MTPSPHLPAGDSMRSPSTLRPALSQATLLLVVLLLAASGCRSSGDPPAEPSEPENPMLPLPDGALLYYDDRGGITDSTRIVVRDEAGWEEAWDRATALRSEPPPRPRVDFERHMVLVAAAGRMRPGDRIAVDSAGVRTERTTEDEEDVFEVILRTIEGCGRLQTDIHPLAIVRLPRFEGRVSFVERDVAQDCGEDA
ncbi:MAG: hypothetical protein EA352_04205 [Gemmatimonadales bacterium]|nr:MAG: hypothetical protein EA352_04205 [Gemmatimonadales bacterium]